MPGLRPLEFRNGYRMLAVRVPSGKGGIRAVGFANSPTPCGATDPAAAYTDADVCAATSTGATADVRSTAADVRAAAASVVGSRSA